jgi:tetratricopeptide (TPR) repeat protein
MVLAGLALIVYMGSQQSGLLQGFILTSVVVAILIAPFSSILGALALVARNTMLAELFSQYYLLFRELTKFILPNDFGFGGVAITNLAVLAVSEGRFLDAKELLNDACTLKIDQALKLSLLGQICAFTGQTEEALEKLTQARQLLAETSSELPDQAHMESLAELYSNECGLLPDIGKPEDALESGLKGLHLREKYCGMESYEVAKTLNNVGYAYLKARKYSEAKEALQRAFDIARKLNKESDYAGGNITNNLGCALLAVGEKERALELLTASSKLPSDGPFEQGFRQYSLGKYYSDCRQYKDAAKRYSIAFAEWEKVQGLHHPDYTECVGLFSECLEEMGKHNEHKKVAAFLDKLKRGERVPPKAIPRVR